MLISERIFEKIKQKGMSQKEFSVLTGIPQSTISDWKSKGFNPSADKMMIICEVLGVHPYELLSGAESDNYHMPDMIYISRDTDEYFLIEGYRKLEEGDKARLMGYLEALNGKGK